MYKRTVFLAFLTIKMTLLPVKAQFYTIASFALIGTGRNTYDG